MDEIILNFEWSQYYYGHMNSLPFPRHFNLKVEANSNVSQIRNQIAEKFEFNKDDIVIVYNGEVISSVMTANDIRYIDLQIDPADLYRFAGPDWFTYWEIVYPYLDQIGTVLGIGGTLVGFGTWIKNKFRNERKSDQDANVKQYIMIFSSRQSWTTKEFAEYMGGKYRGGQVSTQRIWL